MEIPEPRLATTLCVLTGGTGALRVLMVRRAAAMRFMPGAWVFPGGVIEPGDDREDAGLVERVDPEHRAWVVAGAREALEEAGVWLSRPPVVVPAAERTGDVATRVAAAHGPVDGSAVHHLSTWITPTVVPVRFHTRFWVTGIDDPVAGEPDGIEVDEVDWVDPADVDDMVLPLPTRRTLTGFASLGSAAAVLDHARGDAQPVVYQPGCGSAATRRPWWRCCPETKGTTPPRISPRPRSAAAGGRRPRGRRPTRCRRWCARSGRDRRGTSPMARPMRFERGARPQSWPVHRVRGPTRGWWSTPARRW